MDISYFKAVQGATGLKNQRDLKVKNAVINFERQFSSSINFVYNALRNGKEQEFIIVPIKDNKGSRTMCTVYAHINEELNISDIIQWNNKYWLVIETDERTQLYNCATMYICDGEMKFLLNNKIYKYPYYVSAIVPSLDENKYIITSDTMRKIKIPFDEITRQLYSGLRFMGDIIGGIPQVWKITDITPDNGLLQVTVEKDEFNKDTDDTALGLCDYKFQPQQHESELVIEGLSSIKAGKTATYKTNVSSNFQLSNIDGSDNIYAIIENLTDTSVTIKAGQIPGKYITLTAFSKSDNTIYETISIKITSSF